MAHAVGPMVEGEVTVSATPAQVYRLWRDVENVSELLSHVAAVQRLDGQRSLWTIAGEAGVPLSWDMEVAEDAENQRLAWRSIPGAPIEGTVRVDFTPVADGGATRVHVAACYAPARDPDGRLRRALEKISPERLVEDLARMKRGIESGEITVKDRVQETSEESFPASDPPAWTTGRT